jgi:hypothetical protein
VIETAPTETALSCGAITTVEALAICLEQKFGPHVVLVGKAVTLVDMIAAEYLILFHETASGYTTSSYAFNAHLAAAGIRLPLHPIVRLTYRTWDSLAALPESLMFHLPPHLRAAFGREAISAPEFARIWRNVVDSQLSVLRECRTISKVRDLMNYLEGKDRQCWCRRREEYEQAIGTLKQIAAKSQTLADRIGEHREEMRVWRKERQGIEQRMGEDWRHSIQPVREKIRQAEAQGHDSAILQRDLGRQIAIRATAFEEPLHLCRERIEATRHLLAEFRRQRRLLEHGPEAAQARAIIARIVSEAEMARLDLVRSAYLTIEGLEHTNLRPTAWWLPMVSPSGEWFNQIVSTATARLEPLTPASTE